MTLVENEIRQIPAKSSNPQLKREAAYEQVRLEIYAGAGTGALPVRRINEYIKLERKLKPERPRGALALWIASDEVRDDEAKLALESRILKSITRVCAFDGEFSKSCGVFVVPAVFAIDPARNVYSTEARGKLEMIIRELNEAREEGRFSNPV